MHDPTAQQKAGVAAAALAYLCWGWVPIFWKLLASVPALELMAHRVVWCTVFVFGYLLLTGAGRFWRGVPARTLGMLAASAAFIGLNWWLYIWAIANGKIVEASLGYFINPLINVLFGVAFLHERLNRTQWLAVALAGGGVLYLTLATGAPPWIALTLATSFGAYGLIRKLAPVDAFRGLMIEGVWLLPIAVGVLTLLPRQFPTGGLTIDALILSSGPVTALPLLLFAYGARRIPLSMVGILQYISPSMQFLIGVWLYREPFGASQWLGFACIWASLILYTGDSLLRYARPQPRTSAG